MNTAFFRRKSSNSTDVLPAGSRHSRSLSSASDPVSPGRGRRGRVRQLSAGSLVSSSTATGARSPGMPRKVGPSTGRVIRVVMSYLIFTGR